MVFCGGLTCGGLRAAVGHYSSAEAVLVFLKLSVCLFGLLNADTYIAYVFVMCRCNYNLL
jgi:hypothetical protein